MLHFIIGLVLGLVFSILIFWFLKSIFKNVKKRERFEKIEHLKKLKNYVEKDLFNTIQSEYIYRVITAFCIEQKIHTNFIENIIEYIFNDCYGSTDINEHNIKDVEFLLINIVDYELCKLNAYEYEQESC